MLFFIIFANILFSSHKAKALFWGIWRMKRSVYYFISELALFAGFFVLCKLASASILHSQAVLTEDLLHPGRLFFCMKDLVEKESFIKVKGFIGPYYGKNSQTLKKDPTIAQYYIVENGAQKSPRPIINFFATHGSRWRYFSYETTTGTHIGAISSGIKNEFVIIDSNGSKYQVDLTPCKKHIVY